MCTAHYELVLVERVTCQGRIQTVDEGDQNLLHAPFEVGPFTPKEDPNPWSIRHRASSCGDPIFPDDLPTSLPLPPGPLPYSALRPLITEH